MDELNPKARALVDGGRGALRASDADRRRIEAALRMRLGSDVLPPDESLTPLARSLGWQAKAGLALGAGIVVGVALLALWSGTEAPAAVRSAQVPASEAVAPRPEASAAPTDAPETRPEILEVDASAPLASASKRPGQAAAPRVDRLAQEVALLSRATAMLRAGQPGKALKALDEHQRRFPAGALREERRAAKAQALCLLGRVTTGRAELALLPAESPSAARAAQVCDAGSLATPPR